MNAVNWFEIPSTDFNRAVEFYGKVLGKPLHKQDFNGIPNGIFPYDPENGVGGSVILDEQCKPSADAAVIYLNAGSKQELEAATGRVESAGGKVLLPCTHIGEPGYISMILDTEGNRIGLHAPNEAS